MYLPSHFAESRIPVLHDAIRQAAIGTLVTLGAEGMEASHIPMLIDPEPSPYGTLRGHVARANPQWKNAAAGTPALAIFLGPDTYVSPSWYATKQKTGKVVPTWNYVAIHATGTPRFFTDREPLLEIVTRLTNLHEGKREKPWAVTDAPADYIETMLKAIVGFEMPIAKLEGKWKLGQNRSAEDVAGIRAGLAGQPGDKAAMLAAIMDESAAK